MRRCALAIAAAALASAGHAFTYVPRVLHPAAGYQDTAILGVHSGNQAGYGTPPQGYEQALRWTGTAASVAQLPDYFNQASIATSAHGQEKGGYTILFPGQGNSLQHAVMWNASNTLVDLHPQGMMASAVLGIGSGSQVGWRRTSSNFKKAALWHGTSSYTDLHPLGYTESVATDVDGSVQVGWGESSTGTRALLWNGTNAATDLHPTGYAESEAYGVAGSFVGGYATIPTGAPRAALWSGGVFANLHPSSGYGGTGITALTTTQQVGWGYAQGGTHALLWNGTNAVTDLHLLLPSGYSSSRATSIDPITGIIGGYAHTSGPLSHSEAVIWVPVPEPVSLAVFGLGFVGLVARRRARRP